MKVIKVLLCLTLVFLLGGCWNRKELNDLAICVGIGIDKVKTGYSVSVQVVDPAEVAANKGKPGRAPVTLFTMSGATVFEALRKMTTISPRKIYMSHTRMLILGEELAREGIAPVLDFVSRDHEFRTDFYIAVARGTTAHNILKVITPLEQIPANELFASLETSSKAWAPTAAITLDQLIADLTNKGKQAVLTGIKLTGSPEEGDQRENVEQIDSNVLLQYTTLAAFRGDKLIGWLNEKDSKAYNYITGNVKSTAGSLPCKGGGRLTMEIMKSNSKVKAILKNGKPEIMVDIHLENDIGEVQCKIDLTKMETIEEIQKEAEKGMVATGMRAVTYAKQHEVDIFGFGDVIHRQYPKVWKQLEKNWNKEFAKLPVHIKAEVKIRRLGTINNAFKEK
ncbi:MULTISPECIES: Ger(x)C family spore germination protein [Brevibacillus]|jgi:spore germination protein KC|uniref:Ger(x)C family spore germination protein n=1 Tax=Brevibacillus TaxID=55080 RepID=UPI00156BD4A7|nr:MULTISPECIES: Ger(x)C family spore germination protein [Brevibacillus]MBU8713813.1 Ger(x)C family spore germination protein [Brevibacillus parabrevis]NRQ53989.1 Ger(x)C family spore germination protein [Brevibacillus sp. HD1.4A]UED68391.1 Ger(x)C family spore germination protein [Brevibacillus sp. HD3.3A]